MLGKIEGRRRRGRQRRRGLYGITTSVDMSLSKCQETVGDTKAWCVAVHKGAESDTTWWLKSNNNCFLHVRWTSIFGSQRADYRRQNNSPWRCPCPQSLESMSMLSYKAWNFADVIQDSAWDKCAILDYLGAPKVITKVLMGEGGRQEWCSMSKTPLATAGFEDEAEAMSQWKQAVTRHRLDSLLQPPKEKQPQHHLDLSLL